MNTRVFLMLIQFMIVLSVMHTLPVQGYGQLAKIYFTGSVSGGIAVTARLHGLETLDYNTSLLAIVILDKDNLRAEWVNTSKGYFDNSGYYNGTALEEKDNLYAVDTTFYFPLMEFPRQEIYACVIPFDEENIGSPRCNQNEISSDKYGLVDISLIDVTYTS